MNQFEVDGNRHGGEEQRNKNSESCARGDYKPAVLRVAQAKGLERSFKSVKQMPE